MATRFVGSCVLQYFVDARLAALGVFFARATQFGDEARQMVQMNSLRQIALAMHNYHDTMKEFPTSSNFDKEGRPLLSWRVHILPYLEELELYEQFKLDEPWDSPSNIKLIERMPEIYRNLELGDPTKTSLLSINGTNTFMGGRVGRSFNEFVDGSTNTIMLVEANEENAVVWTKPGDLYFDAKSPNDGLGSARPEGCLIALVDGSIRLLPNTISAETILRLVIINDGEIVNWEDF